MAYERFSIVNYILQVCQLVIGAVTCRQLVIGVLFVNDTWKSANYQLAARANYQLAAPNYRTPFPSNSST